VGWGGGAGVRILRLEIGVLPVEVVVRSTWPTERTATRSSTHTHTHSLSLSLSFSLSLSLSLSFSLSLSRSLSLSVALCRSLSHARTHARHARRLPIAVNYLFQALEAQKHPSQYDNYWDKMVAEGGDESSKVSKACVHACVPACLLSCLPSK
jgi:hypothetical protein